MLIVRQLVDRVQLEGQEGTTVTLNVQLRRGPEVEQDLPSTELAAVFSIDREGQRPVIRVAGVVAAPGAGLVDLR